jgi:hypothetical protein
MSESSLASMMGEINDFAGSDSTSTRAFAAAPGANDDVTRALSNLIGSQGAVPVVLTGTRPPNQIPFPGLREAMVGAAIVRLLQQISDENPIKSQIHELALQLHRSGGEQIARGGSTKSRKSRK